MKKEDNLFLKQLVSSLEDAYVKLERAYERDNADDFNKTKKIMLKIQKEISEIIK